MSATTFLSAGGKPMSAAQFLELLYRALSDAFAELGKQDPVRRVFVGFQRHLYAERENRQQSSE